jgi:hypothetical protein
MVLGFEEKQAERRRALGAMDVRAAYASRACKRSEGAWLKVGHLKSAGG